MPRVIATALIVGYHPGYGPAVIGMTADGRCAAPAWRNRMSSATEDHKQLELKMTTIDLKLFATLQTHTPDNAHSYPITAGMSVAQLIERLAIPAAEAKLIFIDGTRAEMDTQLNGGERVGIFPPVGGG